MDNMGDWGRKNLINELAHGREMARQLQLYLNLPSSSQESREFLIHNIIAVFERALAMVNWNGGSVSEPSKQPTGIAVRMSESPPMSASPRSEDSDRDFRDHDQSPSGKRKTSQRWKKHIRVNPGMGVEAPLDDGYSWRKYGQKDILGAKFPRGYYRCSHRNVQGCLATKQVQRSDEDPTMVEITYRGKHTCTLASSVAPPTGHQESHPNTDPQQQSQELLVNPRAGLRVLTENLDASDSEQPFASFHFPSTSNINAENQVFLSPMIENFSSPPYMSPATSGTTHFSVSPSGVNSFGGQQNLATSASDINEMISAATSTANSPTVGLEFPFDQFEFDGQNFTFDNTRFF